MSDKKWGGGTVYLWLVIGDDDYVGAESKTNGKEEKLIGIFVYCFFPSLRLGFFLHQKRDRNTENTHFDII